MRILGFILLSCVLGMSSLTSRAQIRIVPRDKLEAVDSPRLSSDSASLSFDVRHIVAKPMKEDDNPEVFRFEMTNTAAEPVSIHRLQTTCSCVSASVGQNELNPGAKTVLTVRYDPKGHLGRFDHKIFVYTRPGNDPAAALRLTVEVNGSDDLSGLYKVAMGAIALRSRDVTFRKDSKSVEVLKFVNRGGKSLKLECEEMFLPQCIRFETRPETVENGQEGEIVITYDPSIGDAMNRVPLILKNLGVSPSRSTINITIE